MDRPKAREPELMSDAAQVGVDSAGAKERILDGSPFGGVAGDSRTALLDLAKVEHFTKKQRIVQQGEPPRALLLLGAGRVKLERVGHGRAFAIGHRGPGETVGETALAGVGEAAENATVLDDVEAVVLPIVMMRKLIATDPVIRATTAAALVQRQSEAEARLASLLLCGVEARLIDLLTSAARRWGRPHTDGQIVTAPFTHADIALLIGSTRETVTLLLGKLRRAGLIAFEHRRIVIRDAAALAQRV